MSRRNLWAGGKIQVGTQTEKNMMNSISSKVLQLTYRALRRWRIESTSLSSSTKLS